MPQMDVTRLSANTFSQIVDRFGQGKDTDHHIRLADGKGLYTSSKLSMTAIKDFFGFHGAMEARLEKREAGLNFIKRAIDREFMSAGLAERALQRLSEQQPN